MNIGILGGTFDPVHSGHLAVAEQALVKLNLAEVIFVPAGNPYFKDGTRVTLPAHRVSMLKLALFDKPSFKVSLLEIERSGPSYSVDTISRIREVLQKEDELFFILGWDSILTLPLWHQPRRLMGLCRFVVALRPGYPRPEYSALEKELPGISERTTVMDNPLIDISSTEIRERVYRGVSIKNMVPPKVEEYIRKHSLYQTGTQV